MDKSGLNIAFFGDSLTEGIVGASYFEILRNKLLQHELINYGKGGDTVMSLNRRLRQIDMASPLDLGILWIGVNDVFVKTSWRFPLIKHLRGQPWAKSHIQFQEHYHSLLEFLQNKITRIITLPPLLIGEDLDNAWNKEVSALSQIIHDISLSYPNVDFIDLREHFIPLLTSEKVIPYVPKTMFRVFWDALFPTTAEESEKDARARGLHFTVDGVHLNRTGAEKVADVLLERIHSKIFFAIGKT
jgi:lysophospholipase L1-like esterase